MADSKAPIVGVIMGSKSDWEYMAAAAEVMEELQVSHEVRIMSAHRTPDITLEYSANAAGRGLRVIIAGAGGAAHLAGVVAAKIIALTDAKLGERLVKWRAARAQELLQQKIP